MASKDPIQPEYGTFPQAARRLGMGVKRLRRRGAEGRFPVYTGETAWPRVKFAEVEAWFRSTRIPVSDHAAQRVDERLQHEARVGGG
jgi:hypothetical protein